MNELTKNDKWMLNYVSERIARWGDVQNSAQSTMSKIKTRKDFTDWIKCFIPAHRWEEITAALAKHLAEEKLKKKPYVSSHPETRRSVSLSNTAIQVLSKRSRQENLNPSELILKYLA